MIVVDLMVVVVIVETIVEAMVSTDSDCGCGTCSLL